MQIIIIIISKTPLGRSATEGCPFMTILYGNSLYDHFVWKSPHDHFVWKSLYDHFVWNSPYDHFVWKSPYGPTFGA